MKFGIGVYGWVVVVSSGSGACGWWGLLVGEGVCWWLAVVHVDG